MKVVIVNKSDSTGGAAVVSFRLLQALRRAGVDASMLVAEKLTDDPHVEYAASSLSLKHAFLSERLKIFIANGFNRSTLFKIDTASDGVALWRHPLVKRADVVCLNWVNQGLLSLNGLRRLIREGKKIVWTMHDMWCFTGICHHSGSCLRYREECGDCPLMGPKASADDLSRKILLKKLKTYGQDNIHFVAVSTWLAGLARTSKLLSGQTLSVIPNAFPIGEYKPRPDRDPAARPLRILFGAARLDDPVKGLPILVETTRRLSERYPEQAGNMELVTFGGVKFPESLDGIAIPTRHLGLIRDPKELEKLYRSCDVVVSTSLYETLPGTLVEGQAFGCVPVSFNRGGQADIITHQQTGFLAPWSDDIRQAADSIAEGIIWASTQTEQTRRKMHESVAAKFSAHAVAQAYISLFSTL